MPEIDRSAGSPSDSSIFAAYALRYLSQLVIRLELARAGRSAASVDTQTPGAQQVQALLDARLDIAKKLLANRGYAGPSSGSPPTDRMQEGPPPQQTAVPRPFGRPPVSPSNSADDEIWDLCFGLEMDLVEILDRAELVQHVVLLETEYKEQTGGSLPAGDPIPGPDSSTRAEALRARARALLHEINLAANSIWTFEAVRSEVRGAMLVKGGLVLVLSGLVATFVLGWHGCCLALPLWACVAGALGGLIGGLRRLNAATPSGTPDDALRGLDAGGTLVGSVLPVLSGMIFAAVLHWMFAAGILRGSLFPELQSQEGCCAHGCQDVAKALLWGFVAGFAERFVPSQIDRLTSAADRADIKNS